MTKPKNKKKIKIKIRDEQTKGSYANFMRVSHTREEFVLDFANIVPPQGIITSRIITSPGHFKRIIGALQENLKLYEQKFGNIEEAKTPGKREIGFKVQEKE